MPTNQPDRTALRRALARATHERLVVYRKGGGLLGVACVAHGSWRERPYVLRPTGEHAVELVCSCPAGQRGVICKHLACGIFARQYHVYACRPSDEPNTNAPTIISAPPPPAPPMLGWAHEAPATPRGTAAVAA